MTPRELAAHRSVMDSSREFLMSMHAGIQATLHNVNRTSKSDPIFTPQMFMPGNPTSPEKQNGGVPRWKRERDAMLAGLKRARAPHPMSNPENRENLVMIDDRAKRAREAKEKGMPREVVDAIMRGVA